MNYLISSNEAKTIGDIKMGLDELKGLLELLESHPRVTFISIDGVELQLAEGKVRSDEPNVVIVPDDSMPAMTEEDFDYYSSPYYDELLAKKEKP